MTDKIINAIKSAHEEYQKLKGGAGSGNFGHSGRPGKLGGSTGGGGMSGIGLSAPIHEQLGGDWEASGLSATNKPHASKMVRLSVGGKRVEFRGTIMRGDNDTFRLHWMYGKPGKGMKRNISKIEDGFKLPQDAADRFDEFVKERSSQDNIFVP